MQGTDIAEQLQPEPALLYIESFVIPFLLEWVSGGLTPLRTLIQGQIGVVDKLETIRVLTGGLQIKIWFKRYNRNSIVNATTMASLQTLLTRIRAVLP